jgi:hypothetical protein
LYIGAGVISLIAGFILIILGSFVRGKPAVERVSHYYVEDWGHVEVIPLKGRR